MAAELKFEGVFPILATPFDEHENPDLESFDRLVRFMAGIGVEGVTILGVLGEANRLLDAEREHLIRTAVAAAGAMPVIVGTSHSGTRAARELSQMAEQLGARAVMVTPHAEAVPNEQRVVEYYKAIGDGIRIPVVLQDHPASTQVHMTAPLLLRILEEVPGIAAIKEEAVPTAPKIRALAAGMKARKVPVLTGLGALYGLFDLEAGSSGFNTGFALPEVLAAMVAAARAGDWKRARDVYTRFLPLIVFEQQPGVAIRKEILRLRGAIRGSTVRHPAAALQPATAQQLRQLIDALLPGQDLTKKLAI
ncbi:MAG TPA: dihydrodipicolinate synthase family protein [Burkholderiales bacterium]|jgi:4-hydroxy-tetrahydrodipicolinate synthase|nr:dihydrodipicolinate synthase family protein [Burkholderiales bacterium]